MTPVEVGEEVRHASGLVLASTSPYRRSLLERLGIPFQVVAPRIDEESLKVPGEDPERLARRLARSKAESLIEFAPGAIIIGSDQVVAFEGTTWGKPGSRAGAAAQLERLAGKTHQLITAVAVVHQGVVDEFAEIATLTMRPLTRPEIARYVEADVPIDCAGSYKLESRGITLFDSISTADHTSITGLPLIGLTTLLRRLGVPIP
ncbi:MAG: nucleoside triphosphate pyrophosphatase [Isosphaeraceae bacterium]